MDSAISFQEALNVSSMLFERKKKFVDIILEDSDFETKLQKIRRCLLEFQTKPDIMISPEFIQNIMNEQDPEKINNATKMIDRLVVPVKDQKKLFDEIVNVIRSDLTDEQKIEKITDILL
jgi:hypothetical protein